MLMLGSSRQDNLLLPAVLGLLALALVAGALLPASLPWSLVGLAGAAIGIYWAARWQVVLLPFFWVISYGLLNWPQWRVSSHGFLNITVPRLLFLAMVLIFVIHVLLRPRAIRLNQPAFWAFLAMLAYFGISAQVHGWTIPMRGELASAPYFRLLAAFAFPFLASVIIFNLVRREQQIVYILVLLSLFAWYALYIGYLQYAVARGFAAAEGLIWPREILSPEYGIHQERGRGPYASTSPQGFLLCVVFFGNLLLLRRVRGPVRVPFIAQCALIPPAIFFTQLRAAYLAFLVASFIWCVWASRTVIAKAALAASLVGLMVLVAVFWSNVSSTDRSAGGVAQIDPIRARAELASNTWQIFTRKPIFGVGFGHYFSPASRELIRPQQFQAVATASVTPHNVFLVILAETGLVGLVLFVTALVMLFRASLRLYRRVPDNAPAFLSRPFIVFYWCVLAAWFVDAQFIDPFWVEANNALLWSLSGVVLAYDRLLEAHRLDEPASGRVV